MMLGLTLLHIIMSDSASADLNTSSHLSMPKHRRPLPQNPVTATKPNLASSRPPNAVSFYFHLISCLLSNPRYSIILPISSSFRSDAPSIASV
ncbi:hypothetical protein BDV95DRAFT_197367 [Massariosphaeria phaeospora]|uniref:Secreted protein n=1 Tax=Massariosphaeria phaeospora TaxID=100035 RepID=A0A7C8HZY0_9PLEO|nr:hypothetical protein BDV95DRAFT_197367 [Massariosphaeria phaeospora]